MLMVLVTPKAGVITIDNTDPQVLTPATISATPSPITGGTVNMQCQFYRL